MIKSEKTIDVFYIVFYFFCMHKPGLYHLMQQSFHCKNLYLHTEFPMWIKLFFVVGCKLKKF